MPSRFPLFPNSCCAIGVGAPRLRSGCHALRSRNQKEAFDFVVQSKEEALTPLDGPLGWQCQECHLAESPVKDRLLLPFLTSIDRLQPASCPAESETDSFREDRPGSAGSQSNRRAALVAQTVKSLPAV